MILLTSCALYSDCWQAWLAAYRKHWLITESRRLLLVTDYDMPDESSGFDHVLEVERLTGKHYPNTAWITRLLDSLAFVKEKTFLLCCEDHWPLPHANWESYYHARDLLPSKADCVRLSPCPAAPKAEDGWFGRMPPDKYRISCGPTLWRKDALYTLLKYLHASFPDQHRSHDFELAGSPASSRLGINVWATVEHHNPFPFFNSAVSGGKWTQNALKIAQTLGITLDTKNRPIL